jgi:predicted Rossmann-fold nucleotide-binding protein
MKGERFSLCVYCGSAPPACAEDYAQAAEAVGRQIRRAAGSSSTAAATSA